MKKRVLAMPLLLGFLAITSPAQVVINEICYHAPDDLSDLQWIELYNITEQPVDLSHWRFGKPFKFEFASGTKIAGHGYAIICRDRKRFEEFYQIPVVGEFAKNLKRSELLELRNQAGQLVDSVEFSNRLPWPQAPDGWTASLERICPTASGKLVENWTSSPLSSDATVPGGTPGGKNTAFSATVPPVISQVNFGSNLVAPGQPISVEAAVQSKTELREVALLYRVLRPGTLDDEKVVPMTKDGDHYRGSVPGQQAGQVVRMRIRATDQNSAERLYPSPNTPRPAFSCLVMSNVPPLKILSGYFIHANSEDAQSALRQLQSVGRGNQFSPEGQARMMAEMSFRAALDLPALWVSLTVSNGTSAEIQKLIPVFAKYLSERDALEQKTLASGNFEEIPQKLPDLFKPIRTSFEQDLRPSLTAAQLKAYETWRGAPGAASSPPGMGNDPSGMLRQFIPLEADYLHLALNTNLNTQQLGGIRDLYRDAVNDRDSLIPDLRKMMSGPRQDNQAEGERLQTKAMAIPASVESGLKQILTPAQARQFAAWQAANQPSFMHHTRAKPAEPVLGDSAFVVIDPQTQKPQLFDFVRIPERSGGWKVHFAKDQSWNEMSTIDLIFEASGRWLLAEPLAYELHRRAGLAACRTEFVRLTVDDHPAGYYLLLEQVNKAFLRRNHIRDDGNMYKANWAGNGLEGQHEKHGNRRSGHEDLVKLVEQLDKTKDQPEEQWALIRREFDVEEVMNHYAIRMLISDWDGFFNNYFLYHDIRGTGKWTFYPWDEDKTWGEYDGYEQEGLLYNMPLSYAAEGDYPPGESGGRPSTSYGFRQWWRAGGYISRPLLANPGFRKLFLARMKELLNTQFTEAQLNPLIDNFRTQLQEEVKYRASITHEDPVRAEKRFETDLASLKDFIVKRRQWLLEQEDIRKAGSFDRASLK